MLSGGLALRKDPKGITEFTISGDPENLKISSLQELKERKEAQKWKRVIFGGDGCGGMLRKSHYSMNDMSQRPTDIFHLAIGDIPLEIPATWVRGGYNGYYGDYSYWSMEPTTLRSSLPTPKPTITSHVTTRVRSYLTGSRTCDGNIHPQACYHYSSVA